VQPPCQEAIDNGQPPGVHRWHACQGVVSNDWPPGIDEWFPHQDGIGGPLSGGDGAHPSTVRRLPTYNPGRHIPRRCKPQEEWAPRVILEAAGWWPAGLRKVLIGANPRCKRDDQHQPGD
jgi:hypothetical protein